jgi:hypothetical protein
MATMLDQPRPPKRYIDEFETLLQRMVDGYVEAEEIDYDELIVMVVSLGRFVDRIWEDGVHSASLGVLEDRNERTLTELNFYRDKEQLDELGPDQIVQEMEQREGFGE